MRYAASKDYNPVTIGIFNGSINYRYKNYSNNTIISNKRGSGIEKTDTKEFNEILYDWLKENDLLNRPVIIFGNYQTVGESNTFVNSDYGYLRSIILLPGCNLNPEKHYQFLLRGCFLLERFNNLSKNQIEKFIIGYKEGINDALNYEKLNDEIVQELIDNPDFASDFASDFAIEYNTSNLNLNTNSTAKIMSIPVQFKIEDDTCEHVKNIKRIMEKNVRTFEDKSEFMKSLSLAVDESLSIIKHDKNKDYNIDLNKYILAEFRCYREGKKPDSYRFKSYYDTWNFGSRYNNGELNVGECGFYGCVTQHRSNNDGHIHTNNPNTFYLLFAYSNI